MNTESVAPGNGHYPTAMPGAASPGSWRQCAQLAEQAVREGRTHLGYLEALLQAELENAKSGLSSAVFAKLVSRA